MNRPDDIRKTVSRTYASAVEQTKATGGSCCSGPAPQGVLTTLAGLLDSEAGGGCCCGSETLPKDQLRRVTEALAGKVASIRVVGRKPEEVLP